MGPKAWGFTRKGVEYRLGVIPFGGYVLPRVDTAESYLRIAAGRRIVFLLGGPAANLLLSVVLLAVYNALSGNLSAHGLLVAPWVQTGQLLVQILSAISQLLSRPGQIVGVVGIVAMGGQHVGLSAARGAAFAAMISLNLAIFNLLPLPPLDGGKIVLDLLQRLQPKLARVYLPVCVTGWVLLLGVILYATVLDVWRCLA